MPALPEVALFRPLCPDAATDQGDPFILAAPQGSGAARCFYVYVTGNDPLDGGAFPVYASDDLVAWERVGDALAGAPPTSHWAPCVRFVPGLARPWVMLYSRAVGTGAEGHVGHKIRRADALTPEGPFRDSGEVLTPDLDFAIDADVYEDAAGTTMLAWAMDFVEDEPYGTGIVAAPISPDLRRIAGPIRVLARPSLPWHLFDAARSMPWKTIPGVVWARGDTVRWSTVEGPVGGLVSPWGRPVVLYSGGCFFGTYAVGALVEEPDGTMRNLTTGEGDFVLAARPERGFHAPGHCSWLKLPAGAEYLMTHARFGAPDAPRQFCLVPLRWTEDGRPFVP
jgi:arabinan endo-1,5-alpha-L-arabinosidase